MRSRAAAARTRLRHDPGSELSQSAVSPHTSRPIVVPFVRTEAPPQRSIRAPFDRRHAVGRLGEELAEAHMTGLGHSVLARNARTRHGEIDLIVLDGTALVFVEVKARRLRAGARPLRTDEQPLSGLRHRQRARLRRLAAAWLSDQDRVRPSARTIRFDAIGVTVDDHGGLLRIDHLEGAW
jgi:putative endonuclease